MHSKKYIDDIDRLISTLKQGKPDNEQLNKIQSNLTEISTKWPDKSEKYYYKVYYAQALIDYFNLNDDLAQDSLDNAVKVFGKHFDDEKILRAKLNKKPNKIIVGVKYLLLALSVFIVSFTIFNYIGNRLRVADTSDTCTPILGTEEVNNIGRTEWDYDEYGDFIKDEKGNPKMKEYSEAEKTAYAKETLATHGYKWGEEFLRVLNPASGQYEIAPRDSLRYEFNYTDSKCGLVPIKTHDYKLLSLLIASFITLGILGSIVTYHIPRKK